MHSDSSKKKHNDTTIFKTKIVTVILIEDTEH